jgi:hypothetical protein
VLVNKDLYVCLKVHHLHSVLELLRFLQHLTSKLEEVANKFIHATFKKLNSLLFCCLNFSQDRFVISVESHKEFIHLFDFLLVILRSQLSSILDIKCRVSDSLDLF